MNTWAPRVAKWRAMERPSPEPPPVRKMRLEVSRDGWNKRIPQRAAIVARSFAKSSRGKSARVENSRSLRCAFGMTSLLCGAPGCLF